MAVSTGAHHLALITSDLNRFIDFYRAIFDAEVVVDMEEAVGRHAMIDLGGGFMLHPFEMPESDDAVGSDAMFSRGHIDHLAIAVEDAGTFEEIRSKLVAAGACDGSLTDFGSVRTVWFEDPDGMGCEIAMTVTGEPLSFEDRIIEAHAER